MSAANQPPSPHPPEPDANRPSRQTTGREAHAAWLEGEDGVNAPLRSPCKVGRSPGCGVVVGNSTVSREHAMLQHDGEGVWWLSDLGSSNGTFLNGRKIFKSMALSSGDLLTFGTVSYRFCTTAPKVSSGAQDDTQATALYHINSRAWLLLLDIIGFTRMSQSMEQTELSGMVAEWTASCRRIIEGGNGTVNKYIGDALFAYWRDRESPPAGIGQACQDLAALNSAQSVLPFRILLHWGEIRIGGEASMGEESLSGKEVNFLFKAEKVASFNAHTLMVSQPAADILKGDCDLRFLGQYPVPGFPGAYPFYTLEF